MVKAVQEKAPDLDQYLRLVEPYAEDLKDFSSRQDTEYGARFAFLFRQVVNLLVIPCALNERIPQPFILVARRFLERDHDTVRHFSYEDNRHSFLSDLYDWLQIHQRGRKLREVGRD